MARRRKKRLLIAKDPIEKALYPVSRYFAVIDESGDTMVDNYSEYIRKIRTDMDYREEIGAEMLYKLATWYQAMEDINLAGEYSKVMREVKRRYYRLLEAQALLPRVKAEVERIRRVMRREERVERVPIKVEILAR